MKKLALVLVALGALVLPGTALARDRDRDGLPDRWERKHQLSTKKKSANADPDRDRVDNGNEWRERTDPRDGDTDNDGKRDGREDPDRDKLRNAAEDATGNDPRNPDTDLDGLTDGRENAGAVRTFEDGLLTIGLAGGGTLTARVLPGTSVTCSSERQAERRYRSRARAAQDPEEPLDPGEENEDDDPGFEDDPLPDEDEDPFGPDFGDDLPGDDSGGDGKHEGADCPDTSLRRGARVHEAEILAAEDEDVFRSVELVR